MLTGKYKILYERLIASIDKKRIFHDPLSALAYGTDASFYRLIPKLVIIAKDEIEVSAILKETSTLSLPVTFRAAGTSLSGQAITCLLYTSDAADEEDSVDLGGRRVI